MLKRGIARAILSAMSASAGAAGAANVNPSTEALDTAAMDLGGPMIVADESIDAPATAVEQFADEALDAMENGEDDAIVLPAELTEDDSTVVTAETADYGRRSALSSAAMQQMISGGAYADAPVAEAETAEVTETEKKTDVAIMQATVAAETTSPDSDTGNAPEATETVSHSEYAGGVNEFLNRYPTGTPWDGSVCYKGSFYGCAAYALEAQDSVYGADAPLRISAGNGNVKQYSMAHVEDNTHWVFVLDTNGNDMTVAEANVNNAVRIGSTYHVSDVTEVINR